MVWRSAVIDAGSTPTTTSAARSIGTSSTKRSAGTKSNAADTERLPRVSAMLGDRLELCATSRAPAALCFIMLVGNPTTRFKTVQPAVSLAGLSSKYVLDGVDDGKAPRAPFDRPS